MWLASQACSSVAKNKKEQKSQFKKENLIKKQNLIIELRVNQWFWTFSFLKPRPVLRGKRIIM